MKVALLGTDNFSAVVLKTIINNNCEVIALTHSKNIFYKRFKSVADHNKIPFFIVDSINSSEAERILSEFEPGVIFTAHFDRIIKPNIINIAKVTAINLHPSLLPKYRGMSPFQSVLRFGESEAGYLNSLYWCLLRKLEKDAIKQSKIGESYYGKVTDDDRDLSKITDVSGYNLVRAMSKPFLVHLLITLLYGEQV